VAERAWEPSSSRHHEDSRRYLAPGNGVKPPGMRKTDVTPVGLAMTRDGKTAFVTLGHATHAVVVDVPTPKVQGYILVGKRSWGTTLSRDKSKLYVANGFGDDITIIDTKSARRLSRCRSVAFRGAWRLMISARLAWRGAP